MKKEGIHQIQDGERLRAEECGLDVSQVDEQETCLLSVIGRAPEFSMTSTLHLQTER